jgi:hypothetical protein
VVNDCNPETQESYIYDHGSRLVLGKNSRPCVKIN